MTLQKVLYFQMEAIITQDPGLVGCLTVDLRLNLTRDLHVKVTRLSGRIMA
jgi:hypothetical protein